jgi:NAD(P)H dehydrogenase (quinone)
MSFEKTLIITAHPSKLGWTNLMSVEAKKILENQGKSCTIINLYEELTQTFFGKNHDEVTVIKHQKLIEQSTDIILAYPLWWGSVPAIMKNWMDTNFSPKFAYEYQPDSLWYKLSKLPHGKLNHTRLHQLVTCGGAAWKYLFLLSAPTNLIRVFIGMFCGMRQGFVKVYGGIATIPKDERSIILSNFAQWFAKKVK